MTLQEILALHPKNKLDVLAKSKAATLWQPVALQESKHAIYVLDFVGLEYYEDKVNRGLDWVSGDPITAEMVARRLSWAEGAPVTVYINSQGGSMLEGQAIYNLLKQYSGHVTVKIIGIAASAASLIAMGGDEIEIAPNGTLMIHNAMCPWFGNRHDFAALVENLKVFDNSMAKIYQEKTGLAIDELLAYMDKETYFNAQEALQKGFVHRIFEENALPVLEGTGVALAARVKVDSLLAQLGLQPDERLALLSAVQGGGSHVESSQSDGDGDGVDLSLLAMQLNLAALSV